ncbi:MAG: hypothetical protein HZB98_10400 [Bacteroidia bacterium]|nr:hypothetical protein [Bacteroidia bacterium]
MKRSEIIFSLLFFSLMLSGQRKSDYGVFGGVSSYFGDINPNRPLYAPLPAAGLFYRYNLHPRQSIRANVFAGGLQGSDRDFDNDFQQTRNASFSGMVAELAAQFEFNFFPYATDGKRWNYTPYIAGGLGMSLVNTQGLTFVPVIPFSIGFKINVYKNLGIEAEYGFRKTFYDNFDGLNDMVAAEDQGWLHNNDWYTFTGICVTWKIYNKLAGCPAYNDVDSKRKR